ncbi:MAG TPA: hypothetical protein ENF48_10575 [Desulfobacteraceae bacterium]|nr:DUF5320 domain-containing protein [Deltaproteobacteria bacterium]MBW2355410.1 DUF5320 domain-containing protein [Deltaproteobacteria bacterium]RLB99215.1 MAG: hypothetical protein DRH76_00485 [Deltaproteobacteria bacterium]HDI60774.1 hypothetical protein [Desulfobacteraceae bacterium]
MPGGDRTGPLGQGSRTGRGLGYCTGNPAPGFAAGFGGWGRGGRFGGGFRGRRFWGYGRGWGAWPPAAYPYPYSGAPDPEAERRALQDQATFLQRQMDDIQRRLASMDKGGE